MNFRRSVIIAELWRPKFARPGNFVSNFCVFKRHFTVNFSKFCSESFHRLTIDVVVFKCRKICPNGNRLNRALFTWQKNFGCLSKCRYCVVGAENLPGLAPNNVLTLTVLQISPKSVYFRRSYSRSRKHSFFASYKIISMIRPMLCFASGESHTRTAVRECCKDNDQSQWEKPKFDPRHP